MGTRVLSVGQCNPDHNSIKYFLDNHFNCTITRIDSTEEALEILSKEKFDLVLVNRKLDIDYTDGTILIDAMQKNPDLKNIPVMLISNYPEYQKEAVELGAVLGFGKGELRLGHTIENVSRFLEKKSKLEV